LPAFTDGAALDGASGNLVSIRFDRPADAERFALEPGVLSVRLPRQATETITPLPADAKPATAKDVLAASGMQAMHRLGYAGSGVKILVIGTDFTGADKLIGTSLPKKTRILDLTTELNPEIVPSPPDPNRAGNGTAAAKAIALAAPDSELVLVRIDPGAIFQVFGILRMARGETTYTDAMRSRLVDITTKTADLTRRKEAAVTEYRIAFEDLSDDDVTKARRTKAKGALDAVIAEQGELAKRTQRFNAFQKDILATLPGARVVVNTLVWESGFPLDAMSQLSRTLEQLSISLPRRVQRPGDPASAEKPQLVWVQASSGSGAAVWGGPFIDANHNGIMEFAPVSQPLPLSNWSPEMNFLGVRAPTGETAPELAMGTKIRVTMQWREPRDPSVPNLGRPAYPVVLHIWRQLDPKGDKQPSDEMAETARSAGGPYPIQLTPTFVVYEQILEFTIPVTGRYALVVGTGYQPEALLPALRREFEVYPRIVLETLSAKPGEGHAVFRSYVTPNAGVGIPADSTGVITVGVPVPGELSGGGAGLTLRGKPDLFGPDTVDISGSVRGTGVAAAYVGGMAATLVQAGAAGSNVFESARFEPGKMAIVPESWMKFLNTVPKQKK
jgi:hypothetical protein